MTSQEGQQRNAPYKPSRWWLAVWIAITAVATSSWAILAMLSYMKRGQPVTFADAALIGFLALTPAVGAVAVGTWVIRNAQSKIADHAEQEAERRHTEQMAALDQMRRDSEQRKWEAIRDREREQLASAGVTPMRPRAHGS